MLGLHVITDPRVEEKFNGYPKRVRAKMLRIRKLVLDTAAELKDVAQLEETLKWGEPSYLTKHGSTLRMDWKEKAPDQYALYFKCTSKLVPTFKQVFGNRFKYENDRAIVFDLDEPIPLEELRACIAAALMYHRVKHLEDLGMKP